MLVRDDELDAYYDAVGADMIRASRKFFGGLMLLIIIAWTALCYGQQTGGAELDDRLRLPGEKLVFSFRIENGKTLSVCTSENPSYIVYRFGARDNIELEFPEDKENSWDKFAYYVYARGGYVPENGPGKPSAAVFFST